MMNLVIIIAIACLALGIFIFLLPWFAHATFTYFYWCEKIIKRRKE